MQTARFVCRLCCALFLLVTWMEGDCHLSEAGEPVEAPAKSTRPRGSLQEYRSQYLVVFTDLPIDEAKPAIKKLEQTLANAAKYWGHDPRGQLECYLLQDVENLADVDLPHRLARVLVGGVGGVTIPNLSRSGKNSRNTPTILASTRPGVAEHEIVHAYCTQTFGFTGPDWYKEGMAEMVVLRCTKDSGVVCSLEQIQQLHDSRRITIEEVLAGGQSGNRIFESLKVMLADPKNHDRHVPFSDWQQRDTDNVTSAREEYLRSWALCYMLLHNPNYSPRFRMLGRKYVTSQEGDFASVFASMQKEIAFEYSFFLQNICVGYRVDLCSWDWNKRFRPLTHGDSVSARVGAGQGYQASGLSVTAGQRYTYEAEGTWSTSHEAKATPADGRADHCGRLFGVVMQDFQLSEPFALGVHGSFKSPISGNLYLRCNDAWSKVHDNQGQAIVRLRNSR